MIDIDIRKKYKGMKPVDKEYMELALNLARSAVGQTSPNPCVGAVVVNDGQVVGMGAHLKAGEAHAEVHALNMAGERAKDATIYVTLEPCSHFGKTPPCANAIIEAGIKRAVIATTDPNPKVSGEGIKRMIAAGIEVEVGLLQEEANELNEMFFHYMKTKKPFVTMKSATSLDGKIATVAGESKWITSEDARFDAHKYRHLHDAILVGIGTVLADDPSLTTRLPQGGKNPIRVILDSSLRTPLEANVVTDGEAPTWIVTTNGSSNEKRQALIEKGVELIILDDEEILIERLLDELGSRGVMSLFVEGGAEVNGSFIAAKSVNQVIMYLAPKLIGGSDAPTASGGLGIEKLTDALAAQIRTIERIGVDLKIVAAIKEGETDVYRNY